MSASEKLKALEKALSPAPWYVSDDQEELLIDINGVPWDLGFANGNMGITTLRNALPELIALVQAGEAVKDHDDNDPRPLRPTLERLYGKVAALDAKLGEEA
jgi:hypothetical protein